jgi:hypothetical protein
MLATFLVVLQDKIVYTLVFFLRGVHKICVNDLVDRVTGRAHVHCCLQLDMMCVDGIDEM